MATKYIILYVLYGVTISNSECQKHISCTAIYLDCCPVLADKCGRFVSIFLSGVITHFAQAIHVLSVLELVSSSAIAFPGCPKAGVLGGRQGNSIKM
jgi:hypothetical protein